MLFRLSGLLFFCVSRNRFLNEVISHNFIIYNFVVWEILSHFQILFTKPASLELKIIFNVFDNLAALACLPLARGFPCPSFAVKVAAVVPVASAAALIPLAVVGPEISIQWPFSYAPCISRTPEQE